jgi:hypothetical protein
MRRTKLKAHKSRDQSLIVRVPVELARDIYRESGDLQFAMFPATMTLVDTLGKALGASRKETAKQLRPTILRRDRKTTFSHEDLRTPTILTR